MAGLLLYSLTMDVELARQQWQDGDRRIEATRAEPPRYVRLTGQVDLVVAALRKRVGQNFTLAELADAYDGADDWARSCSTTPTPRRRRRPSRARSRTLRSTSMRAARRTTTREARPPPAGGLVIVFVVGIALGEALHDNSTPGGTQTLVRTLNPLPLAPAALRRSRLPYKILDLGFR